MVVNLLDMVIYVFLKLYVVYKTGIYDNNLNISKSW